MRESTHHFLLFDCASIYPNTQNVPLVPMIAILVQFYCVHNDLRQRSQRIFYADTANASKIGQNNVIYLVE